MNLIQILILNLIQIQILVLNLILALILAQMLILFRILASGLGSLPGGGAYELKGPPEAAVGLPEAAGADGPGHQGGGQAGAGGRYPIICL
jgi:hypothetical protein